MAFLPNKIISIAVTTSTVFGNAPAKSKITGRTVSLPTKPPLGISALILSKAIYLRKQKNADEIFNVF